MESINFEFLRQEWSDLALGGFAEAYAHADPQSARVKLRMFAERMVGGIYDKLKIPAPLQPDLIDLLKNDAFREVAPASYRISLMLCGFMAMRPPTANRFHRIQHCG